MGVVTHLDGRQIGVVLAKWRFFLCLLWKNKVVATVARIVVGKKGMVFKHVFLCTCY